MNTDKNQPPVPDADWAKRAADEWFGPLAFGSHEQRVALAAIILRHAPASAATGDKERAIKVSSDESGANPNTYTVGFQGGFLKVVLDRDAETTEPMVGDIYRLPLKRIFISAAEQLEAAIEAAMSADAARKPDGGEERKP